MDRLYSPNHYWLKRVSGEDQPARWHIGFTRFAQRMLGDIVEFDFETQPGTAVQTGQIIGWVEAFKAVSDVYCVVNGTFEGVNPALKDQPDLIDSDAHGAGWLYAVTGEPDEACFDANGYAKLLDGHIDRLIGEEEARMAAEAEGDDA
jgi:glycine cleavage system H protein